MTAPWTFLVTVITIFNIIAVLFAHFLLLESQFKGTIALTASTTATGTVIGTSITKAAVTTSDCVLLG